MTPKPASAHPGSIRVFDRGNLQMIDEKVYGEAGVRFLYQNPVGSLLESTLLSRPWFSKLYGAYQDSPLSGSKVAPFIQTFDIPMEQYENGPFRTFNDFFIRKLKPGARSFQTEAGRFSAPAEGRYLVFPSVTERTALPIKGAILNGPALLGNLPEMKRFHGGPGFIARLCPVDYHRFHFPDSGEVVSHTRHRGPLHSVNPIALSVNGELLFKNEREVTVLKTQNFGTIAYVEVGAICVGKIVQSHHGKTFQRGEEKGYFLFGGSTVIVVAEPGSFKFDPDLISKSEAGIECLVRIGEGIATRV